MTTLRNLANIAFVFYKRVSASVKFCDDDGEHWHARIVILNLCSYWNSHKSFSCYSLQSWLSVVSLVIVMQQLYSLLQT